MDLLMSLTINDKEGQAIFEMTAKEQFLKLILSCNLSDPITLVNAPRV